MISSNGAVRNEGRPASLVIIGAGAVGVEFADIYNAYGTAVTLLEALPRIVPIEDEEVSTQLARVFARRKIEMKTGAKVQSVVATASGVRVTTDTETIDAEQVLMAVGRAARVKGVGLEALGLKMERNFVKVSPTMETSVKGVYAIGDMAGAPLLAHKAMAEGVVAAEAIAGKNPRPVDYANVPSCTYCRPQVASIGLSEAKAKEHGREVTVGKFPFTASGKAVALGETDGFVKVVADKATGEIRGHRDHPRVRGGQNARGDARGDRPHDPRASDPVRGRARGHARRARPRDPPLTRRVASPPFRRSSRA